MLLNFLAPVPRHRPQGATQGEVLAEIRSPLYAPADVAERELQLGKVENLRVAARSLDGIRVPKGAIFSFWRQVGRPTKARGYVVGRELRQGCLIPTVAGGICQLSNSLYQMAPAQRSASGRASRPHPAGCGCRFWPGRGCDGFLELCRSALPGDG